MSCVFFNDTATTEIYTLSLHDALPISRLLGQHRRWTKLPKKHARDGRSEQASGNRTSRTSRLDRKSTRLNSSHANISYAVFCLKKKKYTSVDRRSLPTRALAPAPDVYG